MHKIVVITPAGRQKYLEILNAYIQSDPDIAEWILFDNCRAESDREYINHLAATCPKVRVEKLKKADGTNMSVNQIYATCNDVNTFYIKLDDDIVYLDENFAQKLYAKALEERQNRVWFSPLVVNNAICTFLIKHFSKIEIPQPASAQASCEVGWKNPAFANMLHTHFIKMVDAGQSEAFHVPDTNVSATRFSINCIGFFGETIALVGDAFCPQDVDDEEWISAVLPLALGKSGMVVGDTIIAHFAFFTQEAVLLTTPVLDEYRRLASVRVEKAVAELEAAMAPTPMRMSAAG